ncbi:carboxypeptidase-like regulatory domain-containing protein [Tunturiibacter empetritectus]|uniref:Carboxypeptidase regulatory-like domain-containing protein n=2 Tax=Tunturiibacter TaxID=3154218 RepID=A0A852V813_9BACT|nr:carboxypeptidase-like regulatory domain-containing protein [Edaphobacter lichenicola]NYF89063.1 hypothetical protein [Edaphobacter lichenicola]
MPDSPGSLLQTPSANIQADGYKGTAQINGAVEDVQGVPVSNATIVLNAPGKLGKRTTTSGSDGTFTFTALPAGEFRLLITAPGLDPYTSPEFSVLSGAIVELPKATLKLSTSSSINVYATSDQIAQEQVHEQEKQRVLAVFPNFYTSYIWDAEPMSSRQKYSLAVRSIVDPVNLIANGAVAGFEQLNNSFSGYGSGIEGYGKRFGAAVADDASSRLIGSAILPSLLHQDPRYFYQGTGGFRSRSRHAVFSTFRTRGDDGLQHFNYSRIIGSLSAGAISNAYYPASDRGAGLTFRNFGITIGGTAADNLIREFVLRSLVPSVPAYANGKSTP